jgi:hypothetical protein
MPKIVLMARRPFAISVNFLVSFAGPEVASSLITKLPLKPRVRGTHPRTRAAAKRREGPDAAGGAREATLDDHADDRPDDQTAVAIFEHGAGGVPRVGDAAQHRSAGTLAAAVAVLRLVDVRQRPEGESMRDLLKQM